MAQTPPVDAHEAREERDARQARLNRELHGLDADEVVRRTLQAFDGESDGVALTTSFGIQSAVMLHLVTRHKPNIPVIWIDTGYLPPETYQYAELLTRRLNLNLRVFQPGLSAARMEATLGPELWASDHAAYGRLRKVQPMARALGWLQARARAQAGEAAGEAAGDAAPLPCIFTGLRAAQTQHRQTMHLVNVQRTPMPHFKVCPLLHWTQADVAAYFSAHDLPHHPLEAAGYTTVGDVHSSAPAPPPGAGAEAGADAAAAELAQRGTRFGGRAQECGLHVDDEEGGAGGAALVPAAMDLEVGAEGDVPDQVPTATPAAAAVATAAVPEASPPMALSIVQAEGGGISFGWEPKVREWQQQQQQQQKRQKQKQYPGSLSIVQMPGGGIGYGWRPPPPKSSNKADGAAEAPQPEPPRLMVFGRASCGWCAATKAELRAAGLPFDYRDVGGRVRAGAGAGTGAGAAPLTVAQKRSAAELLARMRSASHGQLGGGQVVSLPQVFDATSGRHIGGYDATLQFLSAAARPTSAASEGKSPPPKSSRTLASPNSITAEKLAAVPGPTSLQPHRGVPPGDAVTLSGAAWLQREHSFKVRALSTL